MTEKESLIWDETFPSFLLKGGGVSAFLHGQTTAHVFAHEQKERIFLSSWLSTKGILKALLEIRLSNNMAEIVIISGEIKSVIEGFKSVIFPADKVVLEVLKPIRRIQKINNFTSWKTSPFSWIDNNDSMQKEISEYKKATQEELMIWKMRQGLPSFNREINGETNPYELGLGDTISLDKGCYLGQESIARIFRSKSLKYQLRYWESNGNHCDFEVGKKFFNININPNQNQNQDLRRKIGFVTSSIRTNENLFNGLALIKSSFIDQDIFFSESGEPITIKKPISFSKPY